MSNDYHGPKPVTKSDVKLAKKHLKARQKLAKKSIVEHTSEKQKTNVAKSKSYNQGHITGHRKELKQIKRSLNTISKLHPL